ncbi:uncharacterized protein LOC144315680 isoform X2 [Canis aureus]
MSISVLKRAPSGSTSRPIHENTYMAFWGNSRMLCSLPPGVYCQIAQHLLICIQPTVHTAAHDRHHLHCQWPEAERKKELSFSFRQKQ